MEPFHNQKASTWKWQTLSAYRYAESDCWRTEELKVQGQMRSLGVRDTRLPTMYVFGITAKPAKR